MMRVTTILLRIVRISREAVHTMHPSASFVVALVGLGLLAQAQDRMPVQPAQQLIADVIYNELNDRGCDSFWQYGIHRVSDSQNVDREQVETSDGPIFRLVKDHGNPLNAGERRREDLRLEELVQEPGAIARVRQEQLKDEARMRKVIELLPRAFLFEYAGPSEGVQIRLSFRPNPAFTPASYEARILHALGGTLVVNQRLKRLIDVDGQLTQRVDFGYGILGHVEKGGIFEIRREQVSEAHWKTNLVEIHIQGKVLLFKNVTKDQRESRSDFRPVPLDISLAEAKVLLDQAANTRQEALLESGSP
jgi:hypothetical protein